MTAGIYPDREGFAATWALEREFLPVMEEAAREARYTGWKEAVARVPSR